MEQAGCLRKIPCVSLPFLAFHGCKAAEDSEFYPSKRHKGEVTKRGLLTNMRDNLFRVRHLVSKSD